MTASSSTATVRRSISTRSRSVRAMIGTGCVRRRSAIADALNASALIANSAVGSLTSGAEPPPITESPASIVALILLFATFEIARRSLPPSNALVWSFLFNGFLPWQKILAMIAGGMIAGYFGSWLSVRESGEELA